MPAPAAMQPGSVPVPDPTLLTTEQLTQRIAALKELVETRLNAMDRASQLLHENVTRIPTETDRQVMHLRETSDEKFSSIQLQFVERDVRSKAAEIAAQVAVGAALQAQKEAAAAQNDANAAAITKSEAATVKQIDGIQVLLATIAKSFDEKIEGVKSASATSIASINSRLDRGEGVARGGQDSRTEKRADTGTMIAFVSLGLSALVVLGGLVAFLARQSGGGGLPQPQIQYAPIGAPVTAPAK